MIKYPKYKDSGIDAIEEIPEDWNINRLKALGEIRYGLGQPPKQVENGLPIVRATNISCGKIVTKDMLYVDPHDLPYDRKPILKTGEIIVVRSGAYTGDSAIIPQEYAGSVAGYDMVYTPKFIHPKFLAFSILSNYVFKDQLVISSLRAAQPHLNKEELGNAFIAFPCLKNQIFAATCLENETSAIDSKVSLLEQKIVYYQELRKSLINETVCRGLDKGVKLKESGIEWIGEIPEHWEVKRLKDIGYLYSGLSGKSGDDFNQEESTQSKKYIPFTNIANNQIIDPNDLRPVLMRNNEVQNRVRKNDLFFLMSSENFEDLGKTAILVEDLKSTYLNSFCKGFRITKKQFNPNFINYLLTSKSFKQILSIQGKGFTRINLKIEKVTDFKIISPPKSEQSTIVHFLDEKTQKIDGIVANLKSQIELLKELRKTLINDVVTGKIKVTEG